MATKTFSEIAEEWKKVKRMCVKKSSFSAYALVLSRHLLPYFGGLTEITDTHIQDFVWQKCNEGLSVKSVKDIVTVLKMVLKFGRKKGYVQISECDVVYPKNKGAKQGKVATFSVAMQRKLMSYIKSHFTFKNLGIYICLSTGMRIGELCALKWGDIDVKNEIIIINKSLNRIYVITEKNERYTELVIDRPKTISSIRDVPISNNLLQLLKPIKKIVVDDCYVLSNDIVPLEPRTYRCYYKKLIKSLNLPDLKFHGLRHSFATRCIESNCDYKTVSALLGHASISTTLNLYVHPDFYQKKRCINKMIKHLE